MSYAVARGLSCAEAVFNAHVTIVVAVETPTIECPSTFLGQSGVKTLLPGTRGYPVDVVRQNPTPLRPTLGIW